MQEARQRRERGEGGSAESDTCDHRPDAGQCHVMDLYARKRQRSPGREQDGADS